MSEWTPNTHHQVPQPAGHECADWYERRQPSAEEILYALAHTKGEADTLLAQNRELVEALDRLTVCVTRTELFAEELESAKALLAKLGKGKA